MGITWSMARSPLLYRERAKSPGALSFYTPWGMRTAYLVACTVLLTACSGIQTGPTSVRAA
jgi:hypothetical protein